MYCRNCGTPDFDTPGKDSRPFWEPDLCLACHHKPVIGYRYNYLTGTLMPHQTVTLAVDASTHQTQDEPLLTFLEAQNYLKTSRSTMYRMIDSGLLHGSKLGAHWRFTRTELKGCLK